MIGYCVCCMTKMDPTIVVRLVGCRCFAASVIHTDTASQGHRDDSKQRWAGPTELCKVGSDLASERPCHLTPVGPRPVCMVVSMCGQSSRECPSASPWPKIARSLLNRMTVVLCGCSCRLPRHCGSLCCHNRCCDCACYCSCCCWHFRGCCCYRGGCYCRSCFTWYHSQSCAAASAGR